MKFIIKFNLMLLIGAILSGCGGSNGKSPNIRSDLKNVKSKAEKVEHIQRKKVKDNDSLSSTVKEDVPTKTIQNNVAHGIDPIKKDQIVSLNKHNLLQTEEHNKQQENSHPEDIVQEIIKRSVEDYNKEKIRELGIGLVKEAGVQEHLPNHFPIQIVLEDNQKVILNVEDYAYKTQHTTEKFTNTLKPYETHILKDSQGKLLGYYGHARLNQVHQSIRNEDRYVSKEEHNLPFQSYPLLAMDEGMKKLPDTTGSLSYKGKMIYSYDKGGDNAKFDAIVNATYNGSNKMLSMKIDGDKDTSYNNVPQWTFRGQVNSDGSVAGHLINDKKHDANFSGGIYGSNGDVLSGSVSQREGLWKGVIGATQVQNSEGK
ncbi:hypothetical protein NYR60_07085 [Actinobacillus genomosp. 2]|uniref:transferrin-binding protein-like solute binding protein n=1 Tax=Actinobacillus genomosp. 2 TaxID=230709 RepID=UPI0024421FA5|nr:transferrin-binding protein-like solute binding protein [Actinobacillus genomosp. 2]WGE31622.1 hypothetical protein NYR60_07085 [Actinobacillus genomosp. 2]